ncbi:hypothetical protein [Roseovarius sp. 2305UL8-3]|uniref:hypothetical protein n=1 Tax=Roseovarius conchicola TaxID=3121636 RepID=UPI0035299EE4
MKRHFLSLLSGLILASAVQAQDHCPGSAPLDALAARIAPNPVCATSLSQSGQTSQHCRWGFDYRAAAAEALYAQIEQISAACFGDISATPNAPDVNHPDSYLIRQFTGQGIEVSVSLKDKAALDQSFVFWRVTPLS